MKFNNEGPGNICYRKLIIEKKFSHLISSSSIKTTKIETIISTRKNAYKISQYNPEFLLN